MANKILCFGSMNIDHVYQVSHFVKPGETLSSSSYAIFPGGKGLNQSIALAQAGGDVAHAGKVGEDGGFLVKLLAEKNVDTSRIDKGRYTGHAIIQVNESGQNCILLHGGANMQIDAGYIEQALNGFGNGDLLVLQNEINNLPMIIEKAHAIGMQIALNPSPFHDSLLSAPLLKVTWFLMNEIEGTQLTGETAPEKIGTQLLQKYPKAKMVLTLGKDGVFYQDQSESFQHGIYDVPVVDTTAAGDTFTGFFLSSVAGGIAVPEALRRASVASSLAVSKKGAASSIPSLQQVLAADLTLL